MLHIYPIPDTPFFHKHRVRPNPLVSNLAISSTRFAITNVLTVCLVCEMLLNLMFLVNI